MIPMFHFTLVIILWSLYFGHYFVFSKIVCSKGVQFELVWQGAQSHWEALGFDVGKFLIRALLGLQRQGTQHHVGGIILPDEI